MHQAYTVQSILKQGVQIESIAAYDNNVILGTRSGQLIMYSVADDGSGAVDMPMFNKNFSKKPITQMEVIAPEHLLFVLTDSMIHICDISRIENNFAFIHSSSATKGCSLFALDVKTPKSTTGETATVIRVCCAVKRRLQFFYWKHDSLHSLEFSIDLKDVPRALCWVDDVVCVGFKDEYVVYNIHSNKPEKHDLIVTSSAHSMDPCICLLKSNMLGVSKDEYLVTIDPSEFLRFKDSKSKLKGGFDAVGGENKSTPKPMRWSGPLLAVVWDEPFAIGRVANSIEVRSFDSTGLNKDTLVQSLLELSKTKFLVRSAKGTIFAAAISELWCIRLVDIPTQRQQLLTQKKFQLAIELTNISEEPAEIKAETIRQIHMRYAKELFANKQFAAAMSEFELAAADPYDVIRLFPNLLQDQSSKSQSEIAVPTVQMPVLEDKDLENALVALIEFLAQARQREVVKLRDTKSTSKSLLSIIDTTLLKCYLQTNDSLIAPLLRLNQCHLEESEKSLKKHDKIAELIILYQMKGKHKKALELLQTQSSIERSILHGRERTIRYLQELGTAELPLIFEFSDWVLQQNAEDGLRIFTENFIEVENLPRASVLDFLLSKHKALVIPYLEHVINEWKDPNSLLHNVLLKQYRERIQKLMQAIKEESNDDRRTELEAELQQWRSKHYEMLKNSDKYSPDVVLKDFPTDVLLEERALILGRLQEHDEVLSIYVQLLGDINKAAKYCEENYENDPTIFLKLLNIIVKPTKQSPSDDADTKHDTLLELLNKYALKIDVEKVWEYLPDNMPLHKLKTYLDTVLRAEMSEYHTALVKKGLVMAEEQRMRELIQQEQNKSFEVNELSMCPACKKRFTNQSVFVRYPNGQIVHLSCHDKRVQSSSSFSTTTAPK